jgi:predicted unusual protein kinase regulating ubiquinone biosynthesis (AarF/ABC1/UbiB family)
MIQLGLLRVLGRRAWLERRWKKVHARNARRLYRGFVRLRGVYIKLGQILSIMGTFLPRVFTRELEGLQDEVPQRPYKHIARAFERSLGKPPDEAFASFSRSAIAAASLGQVHVAEAEDGRKLAVKVLYPNVETIIKVDLKVLRWALVVYRWFVPVRQIERVHEQLTDMLARETNYVHEARCLERMRTNFAGDPDILFPEVIAELSTDKVLTMSFMEGVKISKLDELARLELDPYDVAEKLIKAFYKQLFVDRFFHADPHPGNFFVQRGPEGQPRIVILDFGAASEITDDLATGMLTILGGVMGRDDTKVVEGIEIMGFVAEDGDRALLERATRKYFEKLLDLNITDFGKISPDVAKQLSDVEVKKDDLRELMKSVQYPLGWFFVERAVVIMFGLCAHLAPKMNTMRVGFPYIMQMITRGEPTRPPLDRLGVGGTAGRSGWLPS